MSNWCGCTISTAHPLLSGHAACQPPAARGPRPHLGLQLLVDQARASLAVAGGGGRRPAGPRGPRALRGPQGPGGAPARGGQRVAAPRRRRPRRQRRALCPVRLRGAPGRLRHRRDPERHDAAVDDPGRPRSPPGAPADGGQARRHRRGVCWDGRHFLTLAPCLPGHELGRTGLPRRGGPVRLHLRLYNPLPGRPRPEPVPAGRRGSSLLERSSRRPPCHSSAHRSPTGGPTQ